VDQRINPYKMNNSHELESKMARTTVQMKRITMIIILQTTRRDVLPLQKNNTTAIKMPKVNYNNMQTKQKLPILP